MFRGRMEHFAAARRRLAETAEVVQRDVDAMFAGDERAPRTRRLPKGLTPETAELVERALREADPDRGASDCAEVVGLSRVSARRYLEYFVSVGVAEVRLRYGSAGRPERRYRRL